MSVDYTVRFTKGPWRVDPDEREGGADQVIQDYGRNHTVAFIATGMPFDEHRSTAQLIAKAPELREALLRLVEVIDAAGLNNLSNGVQLGQTSWFVKASDRVEYARSVLAEVHQR